MSIKSEIERVERNIDEAYDVLEDAGAAMPVKRDSASLADTIRTLSGGDYEKLTNKPQIEGNELIGNKSFVQLGLGIITEQEIDEIIYN